MHFVPSLIYILNVFSSLWSPAGVYLTAALLSVFSHALLKMPGPRIRQWFEEVGMNKPDWYRNLSVSVPEGVGKSVNGSEVKFIPDDWAAFTKGWIHCATGEIRLTSSVTIIDLINVARISYAAIALIRSTPQAYKDALRSSADWAQLKAEQRASLHRPKNTSAGAGMDAASHGRSSEGIAGGALALQEPEGAGGFEGGGGDEYTDNSALDSPHHTEESAAPTGKSTLMQQFRRLSLHFQQDNSSSAAAGLPVKTPFARLHSFPQEKIHAGLASAPLCLTASVEEVSRRSRSQ